MNNQICSICHENNCDMTTSCCHTFHRRCLRRWTERRLTCPVCRNNLENEPNEDDSTRGVDFALNSDGEIVISDEEFEVSNILSTTIENEFNDFNRNINGILSNFVNRYDDLRNLNNNNIDEIIELNQDNDTLRYENLLLRNEVESLRRQLRNNTVRELSRNNLLNLRRRVLCLENSLNAIFNSNNSNIITCLREQINIIQNDYNHSNNMNAILSDRVTVLEDLDRLRGNRIIRLREIIDICNNIIRLQKDIKERYEIQLDISNNEVERLINENHYYKNYYRLTRTYFNTVMNIFNSQNLT